MLALTATLYLLAVVLLYLSIRHTAPGSRKASISIASIAALLHLLTQAQLWLGAEIAQISILNVFSLCALTAVTLLLGSVLFRRSLFDAGLVALPIASVALLAEWLIPVPATVMETHSTAVTIHVFSSITAFGILSVAGVYALFAALIDYFLRRHHLNRLIRTLPALEVLEGLLFQLIAAGFIVLTVSLATGLLFVSDLFAQHLVHKTVLSILAWLVFGALLWGRHFRGWRGRLAVRLTLAGIGLLLLSYFGSKLVLEVLLGQSWQS